MASETPSNRSYLDRLATKVDDRARRELEVLFREGHVGDKGAARFVRFLEAVNSPSAVLGQMAAAPHCARLLLQVVTTSHQLSDMVVQNPELGQMILSPDVLTAKSPTAVLVEEGRRLLAHASNYAHQLDRIRWLKQRHLLLTAALDLGDLEPQEEIWARLSDLAEAVLILMRDVVWEKVGEGECPVSLLGMGKFGGRELNYSSDLDLVFIVDDGVDEEGEKRARKFAEVLRGALAERMGRGDLYRVDLRLRPFGSQGPIVSRMRTIESYYDNYAETWEHQAMIRSLVIGNEEVQTRWADLRERVAFKEGRGSWILDSIEAMRRKVEEHADDDDLKRGPGGIRDIEFQVQALQMVHGAAHPELRAKGTLEVLRRLRKMDLIPREVAGDLKESYQFLRKLEHRCQILSGLQTHKLPSDAEGRETVAAAMGYKTVHGLLTALEHHRVRTRQWYAAAFLRGSKEGTGGGGEVSAWLGAMPDGERFEDSVKRNASSLARVTTVVTQAPALVPFLRTSVSLTEQILTGEVEEAMDEVDRFGVLRPTSPAEEFARVARNGWLRSLVRWLLVPGSDLGRSLAGHTDAAVHHIFGSIEGVAGVVGLGSLASRESSPGSDADLIVFVNETAERQGVERALRDRLSYLQAAKSAGSPVAIDLRLRPEGGLGRLGVSELAFTRYDETAMEVWERFALSRSRLIFGRSWIEDRVRTAAYGRPLDDQGLADLLHIKGRIEKERVMPKIRTRHLKLGNGGLDDVVWLVQLWFMRHPWLAGETASTGTKDRLQALVRGEMLTVVEGEALRQGYGFLMELRARLFLFGIADDVLPENPDRLEKLGAVMGLGDANGVLKAYGEVAGRVRGIYDEGIERLRA